MQPADYVESVVVTSSGQPGRPITIKAVRGPGRPATVRADQKQDAPAFLLSGVHDVVVDGFQIGLNGSNSALVIENSSDVTVTNGWLLTSARVTAQIKGDSHRVTVSEMVTRGFHQSTFEVSGGATDTLLTGNSVYQERPSNGNQPAIRVVDAPRTTITNNTIVTDCVVGVTVAGSSAGFGLHNSIVRTNLPNSPGSCSPPQAPPSADAIPVMVDGPATHDSELDYNLLDPVHGGPLYWWAGTTYSDPAAFATATGRGAHDIAADPKLGSNDPGVSGWSVKEDSPAIDSARADAPGVLGRDLRGNPHADKPDTPNTGGGYVDRGSAELLPKPEVSLGFGRAGGGSLETIATATANYGWSTDGPAGTALFYSFNNPSDQPAVLTHTGSVRFTFHRAGVACVSIQFSTDGFRTPLPAQELSQCIVLGSSFTPSTPQRVLDTRSGIGVPGNTPIGPNGDLDLKLPAPFAAANAVVLNVTVTQPTAHGYLTVYPPVGEPESSNINFVAGHTIANLVTVPVIDGQVRLSSSSSGTVHVVADVAGYYGNTGAAMRAPAPARVLDTRSAVGVPGTTPIGAQGRVTVDVSSRVPAGTTAVALNLTVTKPSQSGHITAFPPGAAVPTASNLNFVAARTVNNMVIAPVVDGKVALAHGGSGTVHLIADLTAWFGPGATDTYLPTSPTRILNTRMTGTPVGPGQTVRVSVNAWECFDRPCSPSAIVANVTVTNTKSAGYLTVYPYGQSRPTASAINFTAGQTVANLVTVGLGSDSFLVYNSSAAPVDVLVDQAGFYLSPA
ncbi:hypothetical protein [Asanoa hainanensis]|uniref:hypothetical protein n=1 Tax=Asanoa hainanensis TaxID=560556 RepID=UPI003183E490